MVTFGHSVGPGASRRIALRTGYDEEEGERQRRLLVARAKADKGGEKSIHAANLFLYVWLLGTCPIPHV